MAVYLAVASDVFDGVLFCVFSHEMSWVRCGTKSSLFSRIFSPILAMRHVLEVF